MAEKKRNKPKPLGPRYYLVATSFYLLSALGYYFADGFAAITVLVLGLACFFAVLGYRASRGWVDQSESRSAETPYRHWALLITAIVVGLGAYYYLDGLTINGRPVFAGPVLREVQASASQVVGTEIAAPGRHFVVLDVEIASHLGAPLSYVYHGDFELEVDGNRIDTARGASHGVPGYCGGIDIPRWGSRRCSVVFEVPNTTEEARLFIAESLRQESRSGTINLRNLPKAPVPRVELSAEVLSVEPSDRHEDTKRVEVLVQVRPLDGASPVLLQWLVLRDAYGGDYFDRSEPDEGGCNDLIVKLSVTCHAVYFVPHELDEARLTYTTYSDPLPGAARSAGVTTLQF